MALLRPAVSPPGLAPPPNNGTAQAVAVTNWNAAKGILSPGNAQNK